MIRVAKLKQDKLTKDNSNRFRLVDEDLTEYLRQNPDDHSNWIFLEEHPEFPGHWLANGLTQAYFFDMKDTIGAYKAISPARLDQFLQSSEDLGYSVAFFDDPRNILDLYERLTDPPDVSIPSSMESTVKGFLPFQVIGYNTMVKTNRGGGAIWSTGSGKTVLASALIKHHLMTLDMPPRITLCVVKTHNKINTARSLKRLTNLDSVIVDGPKKKRRKIYRELYDQKGPSIMVLNYEKFRDDEEELSPFFDDTSVLIIWDEMPTKLKNRSTQLYHAVCRCLYNTKPPQVSWKHKRPSHLRQYMLSATPIENSPEDFFNCIRIIDPDVYGTVAQFRDTYVASYSYHDPFAPSEWHHLDRMGLRAAHLIHSADKDKDPEIASQFPKALPETKYVDWDATDRRIYDLLTKEIEKLDLEEANVLALIGVLQMLCDAPSMIANSAAIREAYDLALQEYINAGGKEPKKHGSEIAQRLVDAIGDRILSDARHTKLKALQELIQNDHPNEKILVFSAFNEGLLPILEKKFKEWGINYVRYNGDTKQKQAAQDAFQEDSEVQVFLSSDMGSDSLSLNAGSVVIHYDLPWKWSTYTQRENRVHRVDSVFDKVYYYTLLMADSVEDRKVEIIEKKLGYHDQVFRGAIADKAASAKLTKDDLWYILTGHSADK